MVFYKDYGFDTKSYSRKNENTSMGNATDRYIEYKFWRNKLFAVQVYVSRDQYTRIFNALKNAFGNPSESEPPTSSDPTFSYYWATGLSVTQIHFFGDRENGLEIYVEFYNIDMLKAKKNERSMKDF